MALKIILTGDVNLMNITDPDTPFRQVKKTFDSADLVFSNLECSLYEPPANHSVDNEGFYVAPQIGKDALTRAGIRAVGLANNVNYGEAAINESIARLNEAGIAHTGAGADLGAARAPAIVDVNGVRVGFLQRTSVYWPTHHEARVNAAGVAVIRGQTAYQVPAHKSRPDVPPLNRPGIPPYIITWAEPSYLQSLKEDIAALKAKSDFVVVSCHWGLWKEVLAYMTEIAHGAIDAGADMVVGHGPHYSLPVEVYRGKPIFYGLGSFSFHTGHNGRKHGNWVGMMLRLWIESGAIEKVTFQFVRHNDNNETVLCPLVDEQDTLREITQGSKVYGTCFEPSGDEIMLDLKTV
ncbi:CapA family protein [Paralcaligenes sp. KSB-10]|uniref:CapA family protein n=1 Tax=Paralcaligenes sp. KSB-10 TaxID=2901142 RepID=UPI001E39FFB2|nr:CapA family protein [Paralcaligenes sp. KSB-10]UHL63089.1 CapA family protein [Paralcaligenes sp. KSB-10]